MTPSEASSRLFLFFMFVLVNMILFAVNVFALNDFMLNGVVGPMDYSPENLELISHRLPVYLSLFFKMRYYWDSYYLDLVAYAIFFLWAMNYSPITISVVVGLICFGIYNLAGATGDKHPFAAFTDIMKNKPAYIDNDRTVMIYGQSDVASLYFLNKNQDFLSKSDVRLGLNNSRKTLSIDEVLEYYTDKKFSEKAEE